MDQYITRLVTFSSWPDHVTVSVIALADAGFYYQNNQDEVECFNCSVRITSWANNDNPLLKHLHYSPMCSYAVAKYSRLQTDREDMPQSSRNTLISNTLNESSPVNITSNKDVFDLFKNVNSYVNMESSNYFERRNIHNIDRTEIDYTIDTNRLISFIGCWPENSAVNIADLVEAGMYYTGPGDRVQCAWCKGGLYNWEDGDTVFGEHKRHFPKCPFIQSKFPESGQTHISNTLMTKWKCFENENESKNDWQNYPFVKIVEDLGYGKEIIKEAAKMVMQNSGNFTTDEILDAIFELQSKQSTVKYQNDDWQSYPSVKIMEQMGYSTDIVKKAAEIVMQKSGNFTTDEMFDAIFELESNQDEEEDNKIIGNDNMRNNSQLEGEDGYNSHKQSMEKYYISTSKEMPPTENNNTDKQYDTYESQPTKKSKGAKLQLCEEHSLLKSTTACKICMDKTVNILFLPCRHLVCCEECGEAVKQCPVCRTVIIGTIRALLS